MTTKETRLLATYPTRVRALQFCGEETATVTLERPTGYRFSAGQWFRLTIPTPEGPQTRTLSHVSAPADDWIECTTRLSGSAFKQALTRLAPEAEVQISAPGGRLRLPEAERVAILVGGVGITPVRSLLRDAVQVGRTFDDALLIYGNRDEACEPYVDEFEAMESHGVRLVRVLEHAPVGWAGEKGRITADLVRRYLTDDGRPLLVTGPPAMVEAMQRVLDELEIERDRVTIETFSVLDGGAARQKRPPGERT